MTSKPAQTLWRATHPDFPEDICFASEAIAYLQAHRQKGFLSKEAGGQLFGRATDTGLLVITASGPYKGDARTRTSYRSNPHAASRAIAEMREQGLFYLGEWHTHAEPYPHPSGSDANAFMQLGKHSSFATAIPILLIQGQACSPQGLTVVTCEDRTLLPWSVSGL
jgi:integrative and conjugative element protein (TIGR02256 family)